MPAAAVIPAPIAYIKVVAVKKLVVESVVVCCPLSLLVEAWSGGPHAWSGSCVALSCRAVKAHRLL